MVAIGVTDGPHNSRSVAKDSETADQSVPSKPGQPMAQRQGSIKGRAMRFTPPDIHADHRGILPRHIFGADAGIGADPHMLQIAVSLIIASGSPFSQS